MNSLPRKKELSHFLHTYRSHLQPTDVGLPNGKRRRTPGLRREEVAMLANVGLTWYTKLEQGKNISVSTQVINGIAQALKLNEYEKRHLLALAGLPIPPSVQSTHSLPVKFQLALDKFDPYPAYIINNRWDVIAWNKSVAQLYTDLSNLPLEERKLLSLMITNQEVKHHLGEWEKEARSLLARFRASTVYAVNETWFINLTNRLKSISTVFHAYWNMYDLQDTQSDPKIVLYSNQKQIIFSSLTLQVQGQEGLQMILQLPFTQQSVKTLYSLNKQHIQDKEKS